MRAMRMSTIMPQSIFEVSILHNFIFLGCDKCYAFKMFKNLKLKKKTKTKPNPQNPTNWKQYSSLA